MSAVPAELKAIHDLVTALKPELPHPDPCALCDTTKEIALMDTVTKEQHDAAIAAAVEAANAAAEQRIADAVAEAVTPLQAELDTLRAAAGATEVEQAVTAAVEPIRAEVAAKQSEVEAAQAALAAMTAERDALAAAETERAEAEALAARKDERVAAVTDLKVFTGDAGEAFITAQADGWAALDEDGWAAKLEELGQLKDAVGAGSPDPAGSIPAGRSALLATAAAGGTPPKESAASRLIRAQAGLMTAPTGN